MFRHTRGIWSDMPRLSANQHSGLDWLTAMIYHRYDKTLLFTALITLVTSF